jgi:hypothetical protein
MSSTLVRKWTLPMVTWAWKRTLDFRPGQHHMTRCDTLSPEPKKGLPRLLTYMWNECRFFFTRWWQGCLENPMRKHCLIFHSQGACLTTSCTDYSFKEIWWFFSLLVPPSKWGNSSQANSLFKFWQVLFSNYKNCILPPALLIIR